MAISFVDARRYIKLNGPAIGALAKKGDRIAMDVVAWYAKVYEEVQQNLLTDNTRKSFAAAVTTYAHRDLTIKERAELQGNKAHLVSVDEQDSIDKRYQGNVIVDLSVRRALRGIH